MTKWRKSPAWLVAAFDSGVPEGAERRKMFGYPCAFWKGNMFIGLHQENFVVRLAEEDRTRAGAGRSAVRTVARTGDAGVRGASRGGGA